MIRQLAHTAAIIGLVIPGALRAQDATAATSFDACVLLGREAVDAVMGGESGYSKPRSGHVAWPGYHAFDCRYRGRQWTVQIHLERGRSAEDVKGYMQALRGVVKQTTDSDARPIADLGDEAWWAPIDATHGTLHVVRGTDVLWIEAYGRAPGAGSLEKIRALMEHALASYAKLPEG